MTNFQIFTENPESYDNTSDTGVQDQDICRLSTQIATDPMLLRKKIDAVNLLGIAAERRNIGIYHLVIDSRLIAPEGGGTESLGLKNSGSSGGGKSGPLSALLKLYPKTAYHLLTSASQKSFYAMEETFLSHKAVIFSEGLCLEARGKRDSDLSLCTRSMLSEGELNYQRTERIGGKLTNVPVCVKGPMSLLTTTTQGMLEPQLEDRILTIHPDESQEQTLRILSQIAAKAARRGKRLDENTRRAWQHYHDSLEARDVDVPFAQEILDFLKKNGAYLISARRSFTRVMSSIKTVTILYQAQRKEKDGFLFAELADYAMAYQLIDGLFRESLNRRECQEERVVLIRELGFVTPGKLAEKCRVSTAAISQWIQPRIESGVLGWCDGHGEEITDSEALAKAKSRGAAYIYSTEGARLPSPYELSGDPRWNKGGDLYSLYDLRLDALGPEEYPEIAVPEERVPDLAWPSEEPAEHHVLH